MTDNTQATENSAENQSLNSVDDERGLSVLMVSMISAFVSIVTIALALSIYSYFFVKQTKIGTLDIPAVLQTTELIFTTQLSKPGVTEAERQKAYADMKDIGSKIQTVIDDIQKSCDCILITKAAVVNESAVDYTNEMKAALSLDKIDVADLQRQMQSILQGKILNEQAHSGVAPQSPGSLNPFGNQGQK